MTKEEFAKSLDLNVEDINLVKVGKDRKSAYDDYVDFEKSYEDESINACILSFDNFCRELDKGYGKSDVLQIARLVELNDGIYYDNEFCY